MSKFIQLTSPIIGPLYLNIETLSEVFMHEGKVSVRVIGMPAADGYIVTESVEEVMALINGKPNGPATIDCPKIAPEDVVVGRWYWVLDQDKDGPHIFFARRRNDGPLKADNPVCFFKSTFDLNPIYRVECNEVTAIFGPIPLPSELSSEVSE